MIDVGHFDCSTPFDPTSTAALPAMSLRMLTADRFARLRRGCGRWAEHRGIPPDARRLAILLVATPLATGLACAAPESENTELAVMAITVGPGDAALSPPVWHSEDEAAARAPTPRLTLTATSAQPSYRFHGVPSNDVQGLSYRWWLGHGRGAVGFGLGTIGYAVPVPVPAAAATEGPVTATMVVGSVPTASIGWRYALTPTTQAYADGSGARGLAGEPYVFYRAKAGVEWKPAKSRLGFEGGRLGLQLDSGYRMSLRTRKGGLTIYLRRTF